MIALMFSGGIDHVLMYFTFTSDWALPDNHFRALPVPPQATDTSDGAT